MAASVDVSVEALQECLIQEVLLDGQEIYTQPLSMSENLTKLAHKIDFSKDESEEKGKPTSECDEEDSDQQSNAIQPSLWPWDSIRSRLRAAATELGVLQDVLSIARDKRYMVLDPVAKPSDPSDPKNSVYLSAKKKALSAAAMILSAGFERLRQSNVSVQEKRKKNADYHIELQQLRQRWRLKKVGTVVIGDLSYKSVTARSSHFIGAAKLFTCETCVHVPLSVGILVAGSRYWQNGSFDVTKADDELQEPSDSTASPSNSTLRVAVLSELEGKAYINVTIRDLSNVNIGPLDIATADLTAIQRHAPGAVLPANAHWTRKLEAAQNVIFCKEVFAQLAHEAVQGRSSIPHVVVGNQIQSHLFPGVQLCISLCHLRSERKQVSNATLSAEHNPVLEHSLHQLLREIHHTNSSQGLPQPVTTTPGGPKRRKLAGPLGYTREQMQEKSPSTVSMLDQVMKHARHIVIRKRIIETVDAMAMEIQDPQLTAHISPVSSPIESTIRVCVMLLHFETVRPLFLLHIVSDKVEAICRDGRVIKLSGDELELRHFVHTQIVSHMMLGVMLVAKAASWTTLSHSSRLGVGDLEPTSNASGIMLASPYHDRLVCVRIGPVTGIKVFVQRTSGTSPLDQNVDNLWASLGGGGTVRSSTSSVATLQRTSAKWCGMNEPWREIIFDRVNGKTFVQKFETVLLCLVPERTSNYVPY